MPRTARKKGAFSTYHIIIRGNEKKDIFFSDQDKVTFLYTLLRVKKKYNFLLYGFCLMNNHVHLIIYDNGNDISEIMRRINTSYAMYINKKYRRSGHLLQDRFRSEIIDSDRYLLAVCRYIHNNPVKANLVVKVPEYRWSSFHAYTDREKDFTGLVDTDMVLSILSENRKTAREEFLRFMQVEDKADELIMDIEEDKADSGALIVTVAEARRKLEKLKQSKNILPGQPLEKKTRNEMMKLIRQSSLLTLKEIGELFGGLDASTVSKILKSD